MFYYGKNKVFLYFLIFRENQRETIMYFYFILRWVFSQTFENLLEFMQKKIVSLNNDPVFPQKYF